MNISIVNLWMWGSGLHLLGKSNPFESLMISSLVSLPEGKTLMSLGSCESNHMVNCFSVNLPIVIKGYDSHLGKAEFLCSKALLTDLILAGLGKMWRVISRFPWGVAVFGGIIQSLDHIQRNRVNHWTACSNICDLLERVIVRIQI